MPAGGEAAPAGREAVPAGGEAAPAGRDTVPAGGRLAVGEARDRGAQPGHRAVGARWAGVGDRGGEQHVPDHTCATFRRTPKRPGPSLHHMSEIAAVAAALADRTRARMLEEL